MLNERVYAHTLLVHSAGIIYICFSLVTLTAGDLLFNGEFPGEVFQVGQLVPHCITVLLS